MTRESLLLIVLLIVSLMLPACQGRSREDGPIVWDSADQRGSENDPVVGSD